MTPLNTPSEEAAYPMLGPLLGRGRTAEIYAWGDGQALKLFREGWPEEAIRHEEEIARLINALGLAAPRFSGHTRVRGRAGLIYERIEGASMLQTLLRAPWRLGRWARRFAALHAQMHTQSQPGLPSQKSALARRIRDAPLLSEAEKARLLAHLETLPEGEVVCHGDFHPDNILMAPQGPVVIDWNDAKRGFAAGDVARTILLLRSPASLQGFSGPKRWLLMVAKEAFLRAYLRAYCRLCPFTKEEIEAWMPLVAAARLIERVAGEEEWLLRLIRTRCLAL